MRFTLYGINFAPELTGIGKYSGEMADWLAQRGHAVSVVTAPPYYPQWAVLPGYSGRRYASERWGATGDVSVIRSPLWVPSKVSGKTRLLHLLSFAVASAPALLWSLLRRRPDVLFVVAPTLMSLPVALVLGGLLRIPVWLHVQDFEVDAMFDMGVVRASGRVARWAYAIERFLMRRCDRVSSISVRMCERLVAKGVAPGRVVMFPNWVDVSAIHPLTGANAYRAQFGLGDRDTLVLYSGNLGEKQGLEVVLDAAEKLAGRPDIRFVIAGDGAARARLQARAQGLANVRWLPLQPMERLNELLNAADIHVLPQRGDCADLVMPSKLTGMLASGRATVGTAVPDSQLGQVLETCGVRVEPDDAVLLASALQGLADDSERRGRIGAAGREFAIAKMSREAILREVEGRLMGEATEAQSRVSSSR
jgi:colanic acid biosynthesis glycosyl transferase WcaI